MSYLQWFNNQVTRHGIVVEKLRKQGLKKEAIITYFDFDNMLKEEPDFCPLYKEKNSDGTLGKKCHDMEKLNCYLCACPNFRFKDEGVEKQDDKTVYSFCAIDSKDGKQGVYGEAIHQDCSGCSIPHYVTYVQKHYNEDWKKIMKKCHLP